MSLKMDFVERAGRGESVAQLCREFGISRQTGHKWLKRFREQGYEGLTERSRRPASTPLASAEDVVLMVLKERKAHPSWGPRKLAILLARQLGDEAPSERTVARILKRAELVRERRRKRPVNFVDRAPHVQADASNDVWTLDFKGWWLTRDGQRAHPLTVRDAHSRFVLATTLCPGTTQAVKAVLLGLFRKHGQPKAIQCDNGVPFISVRALGGLSALSAWLMSLGIVIVRSRLGAPQDNGGHERMHRDISIEVESLPAEDIKAQQKALDRWRQEFNHVRPHDALRGKTPAEIYKPGRGGEPRVKPYRYPSHLWVCPVYPNGCFRFRGGAYFASCSLGGHEIGVEPLGLVRVRLWFRDLDLGLLDVEPEVDDSVYAQEAPKRGQPGPKRVA